ncbi:MAG TPA: creatininase family protein [Pseudolabrys sp.]|nr:creatininase family protein [Pseudolabrys sp.]
MHDRFLAALTFQETSALTASSILCLPVGSTEQHGPHLPLETDTLLAQALTARIVARHGKALDLWQLPALPFGLSREHAWASGTVSLSIDSMVSLFRDLGREITRGLPTRNLAVINAHGGNRGILDALAQDLRADHGLNLCILHTLVLAERGQSADVVDIHGGRNETSMMLALAPDRVRKDKLKALSGIPDVAHVRATVLDAGVSWPWTSDDKRLAVDGVIGDAREASAAFGEMLVARVVEAAGEILQALAARGRERR